MVLQGANAEVSPAHAEQAVQAVSSLGEDAVPILQAEIPPTTITAALHAASTSNIRTVVNLAPVAAVGEELAIADPLIVNEVELSQIIGVPSESVTDASAYAARIQALARSVIVTLSAAGAMLIDADRVLYIPAKTNASVVDSTGAGDAFVGTPASALSRGEALDDAARFASWCAATAVRVLGAANAYPDFTPLVGAASRKPSMEYCSRYSERMAEVLGGATFPRANSSTLRSTKSTLGRRTPDSRAGANIPEILTCMASHAPDLLLTLRPGREASPQGDDPASTR